MKGVTQQIRDWFGTVSGPQSLRAIRAGLGTQSDRIITAVALRMARDGTLVREGDAFLLGRIPQRKYATPEDKAAARRIADRDRKRAKRGYAGPQAKKQAVAKAAPKPMPARVFEPSAVDVPPKRDVSAEVAEFVAKGGRIEVLPTGYVAKPLAFIGHKAMNTETMRRYLDAIE